MKHNQAPCSLAPRGLSFRGALPALVTAAVTVLVLQGVRVLEVCLVLDELSARA